MTDHQRAIEANIRKKLRSSPASGKRIVGGNTTDTWTLPDMPQQLRARLERLASSRGYPSVAAMFSGGFKAWVPTRKIGDKVVQITLSEITEECLTETSRRMEALLPSLERQLVISQAEFERDGVADWDQCFGEKITTRRFRQLIKQTIQRDGGQRDFRRLELYLPARSPLKRPAVETVEQFPGVVFVITEGASPDKIWEATFKERERMIKAGIPAPRTDRQLRAFLMERAGFELSADAMLKTFRRRLARWHTKEPFDKRANTNGAELGELAAEIKALPWFIPAAQFFYLLTNRTKDSGSVPEAIRRVISLPNLPAGWSEQVKKRFLKKVALKKVVPVCPEALRETILAREKAGQSMVPASVSSAITRAVPSHVVEQYRRPHETGLNYLQCPGTMMISRRNGVQEFVRAGGVLEADDGSINFPACIPWVSPNGGLITETPCSAKYGVIAGRFQWLRTIDVASRYRPGWVFVARHRGGFRGADVLTLMHGITLQHGIWDEYRFERGVFKSNLVKQAIAQLRSHLHTVISPHSKPFIEGGFNQDWTKLSVHFPQCDLGRYRGDTEAANKLLQSCRRGADDPRKYFPMISDVIAAFEEITQEENRTLVKSKNYGKWVPEERWQRETNEQRLRQADESNLFMFAPYAMEWTVRGMLVGGKVPIFDDMSVPFDFSAPYLHEFNGAKVRLHFDPTAPKCFATPVLMQAWNGHKAGEVLQPLQQINETTGYIRMMVGWGDDVGADGLKAKQKAAVAMRREVRTVMPGGRSGYSRSEVNALGSAGIIEHTRSNSSAEATIAGGKKVSDSRLFKNMTSAEEKERITARAAQREEIEKFERENQHLFV